MDDSFASGRSVNLIKLSDYLWAIPKTAGWRSRVIFDV